MRKQFPLRAAAAKTVHRCQGDTLNEVVIKFPNVSGDYMHYVGLIRVRNLSSLHILELNEEKIKVSKKDVKEMDRLRRNAMLNVCVPFLYNKPQSVIKILNQNVRRSLSAHFEEVAADYSIQVSDINISVETGLRCRDSDNNFVLENFEPYLNDYNSESILRSPYGTVVYIKNTLQCLSKSLDRIIMVLKLQLLL